MGFFALAILVLVIMGILAGLALITLGVATWWPVGFLLVFLVWYVVKPSTPRQRARALARRKLPYQHWHVIYPEPQPPKKSSLDP